MNRLLFVLLFCAGTLLTACGAGSSTSAPDGPAEAYKRLYAAVKSKNTDAIKTELTRKSRSLNDLAAQQYKKSEQQAYATGMTATTNADTLPPMRDERISGDAGAVEVWNAKENRWEDLPFVIEDGKWKLAFGEQFAGAFKSPGMGQDFREKEAANAIGGPAIPKPAINANGAGPQLPTNTGKASKP